MTTDQLPQVRTGGFDSLGDGTARKNDYFREIKYFRPKGGPGYSVQKSINRDGTDGDTSIRLSRKKRSGEWENFTLYADDCFFISKLIRAMIDEGFLPLEDKITFD